MTDLSNADNQDVERWANNRVENIRLPFRRRERAAMRFQQLKSLQKFTPVYVNVQNDLNLEHHFTDKQIYKTRRPAAVTEWQHFVA